MINLYQYISMNTLFCPWIDIDLLFSDNPVYFAWNYVYMIIHQNLPQFRQKYLIKWRYQNPMVGMSCWDGTMQTCRLSSILMVCLMYICCVDFAESAWFDPVPCILQVMTVRISATVRPCSVNIFPTRNAAGILTVITCRIQCTLCLNYNTQSL